MTAKVRFKFPHGPDGLVDAFEAALRTQDQKDRLAQAVITDRRRAGGTATAGVRAQKKDKRVALLQAEANKCWARNPRRSIRSVAIDLAERRVAGYTTYLTIQRLIAKPLRKK
jgi:hypothetical protein